MPTIVGSHLNPSSPSPLLAVWDKSLLQDSVALLSFIISIFFSCLYLNENRIIIFCISQVSKNDASIIASP